MVDACKKVGLRFVHPKGVKTSFFSNYSLREKDIASVVKTVRKAVTRYVDSSHVNAKYRGVRDEL